MYDNTLCQTMFCEVNKDPWSSGLFDDEDVYVEELYETS